MSTSWTDEEIARRIHGSAPGGSVAAEAELVRRFGPRVRLYGLRHLRDEEEAEELAQRVLLVVLQKLRAGDVREPQRLASFVLGTARHTTQALRREIRRRGAQAPLEGQLAAAVPALPEPFPHEALARCLEALSERQRSIVVLAFYQRQDTDDIAAVTGLSSGNVRVIRHRALRSLRDCLARDEEAAS